MGRELRRKQAKREGKNVKEAQKNNVNKPLEMKNLTIIIIVLLLCFSLVYIFVGIFVTKDIKWFDSKNTTTENNSDNNEATINNKILASDSLRQGEEEYFVYYYDNSNIDNEVNSKVSSLTSKVYRVDLGDSFNSNYLGDTASGVVDDITKLKVVDPTVIKVTSGKITEFYSGKDKIIESLK